MDSKLVYVVAAAALAGYGLGELDLGPAQAAKDVRPQITVGVEFGEQETTAVKELIAQTIGDYIKTDYALAKNSISPAMVCDANLFPHRAFSIQCNEDGSKLGVAAVVAYPGQYVPVADLSTIAVEPVEPK